MNSSPSTTAGSDAPSLRVLVVEDNANLAETLSRAIEELGAVVVARAANAGEALDAAVRLAPVAAFVDVHLDDGPSGIKLAETLATEHGCAIVLVTSEPEAIPVNFRHAIALIEKPFRADRIALALTTIAQSLGR